MTEERYLCATGATNLQDVPHRIGQERLEAVETNYTDHKWSRDEVRAIRDHYRAKAKQLKKGDRHG